MVENVNAELEHMTRLNGPFRNETTLNLQTKLREIQARLENPAPRFASVRNANRRFQRAITRHLNLRQRRVEANALERRRATMATRASYNASLNTPLSARPVRGPYFRGTDRGPQEYGAVGSYYVRSPRPVKKGRKTCRRRN